MRTCERHTDCDAADKKAMRKGRLLGAPHGPKTKWFNMKRRGL